MSRKRSNKKESIYHIGGTKRTPYPPIGVYCSLHEWKKMEGTGRMPHKSVGKIAKFSRRGQIVDSIYPPVGIVGSKNNKIAKEKKHGRK